MHKVCTTDCGGNLVKHSETDTELRYVCDKCGRIVTQRKRQPNDERRRIYWYKSEWTKLAGLLDEVALKNLMIDLEKFDEAVKLRDKILNECKPRIKTLSKKKKRKLKKRTNKVDSHLKYEGEWWERIQNE